MTDMFCDEPIIAGYYGSREYDDIDGDNAWFDFYHDLAYHVTEGHRIVLETEHYYISIGYNGVTKEQKHCSIKDFEQDGEWLDPFIHDLEDEPDWVDYESTFFVGERLQAVKKVDNHYLLTFDDFEYKVIPHELKDDNFPSLHRKNHWAYNYVLGAERHIKRKCECGGTGELLLDFVSDYVVRCKNCKKSTWAEMVAADAIAEWNEGHLECELPDITIE